MVFYAMAILRWKNGTEKEGGQMQRLKDILEEMFGENLYQAVLSNPRDREKVLKVKVRPVMLKGRLAFQETAYIGAQVFHKNLDKDRMIAGVMEYMEKDFRQCEIETAEGRATALVSKKGKVTVKCRRFHPSAGQMAGTGLARTVEPGRAGMPGAMEWPGQAGMPGALELPGQAGMPGALERAGRAGQAGKTGMVKKGNLLHNRVKKYLLEEGKAAPFLVDLGVQTKDGMVVKAKYDKFKQINRFLEFIDDILPTLPKGEEIHIIDFGCGKSYLTFAIYYYMKELQGYQVKITGLDRKAEVIRNCNSLAQKYGYEGLCFLEGDIGTYKGEGNVGQKVDMVVTLHACDAATDYALAKAVDWGAKAILSVPCCQHEVNRQMESEEWKPLLKYGLLRERAAALFTDAIRANLLEECGYEVQVLEFIDMEHTPKNILLRAVRREDGKRKKTGVKEMAARLQVETTLRSEERRGGKECS